ncbi:septum formation protein Maf [Enterococcus sp. JM4C]|uniref:Maf family protein n=1 Tax=Candidatus Enterococcus huntleyi TaxID=1857217 RepID=UPI00137A08B0|nr:Maf family protein [Enterococcus sp. JM4C]KAF1297836.1 septum formation protein Maf [Enterococcus sp. JM4C]
MKIILASQSPRRKELLSQLVDSFEIVPADIDETVREGDTPKEYVAQMATAKAAAIAEKYPEALIIACDTIVALDNEILGKPVSREDAFGMLKRMSGRKQMVYTTVVLRRGQQIREETVPAEVTFFEITDDEINDYLDIGDYADKAGSYGIQGAASIFVKKVEGDYYSIVGFPVGVVHQLLKEFL